MTERPRASQKANQHKMTMKDNNSTDNLRDEHSAGHLSDRDSFCAPTVFHD